MINIHGMIRSRNTAVTGHIGGAARPLPVAAAVAESLRYAARPAPIWYWRRAMKVSSRLVRSMSNLTCTYAYTSRLISWLVIQNELSTIGWYIAARAYD